MKKRYSLPTVITALSLLVPSASFDIEYHNSGEAVNNKFGDKNFSPYADCTYPIRVLWGDQHLYTAISVDAGTMCRLGQEDAYRFARGEEVTTTTGVRAKLSRPLEWLVIADHADMYGLIPKLLSGDLNDRTNKENKRW